jgi:hypothetical protein
MKFSHREEGLKDATHSQHVEKHKLFYFVVLHLMVTLIMVAKSANAAHTCILCCCVLPRFWLPDQEPLLRRVRRLAENQS